MGRGHKTRRNFILILPPRRVPPSPPQIYADDDPRRGSSFLRERGPTVRPRRVRESSTAGWPLETSATVAKIFAQRTPGRSRRGRFFRVTRLTDAPPPTCLLRSPSYWWALLWRPRYYIAQSSTCVSFAPESQFLLPSVKVNRKYLTLYGPLAPIRSDSGRFFCTSKARPSPNVEYHRLMCGALNMNLNMSGMTKLRNNTCEYDSLDVTSACRFCSSRVELGVLCQTWTSATVYERLRFWVSTVYCLLSTVYCLLSTDYCLLSTVYCLLSTVYCLLSTVYCLLSTVYCLLSTVYCLLSTVYCLLSTVYCLLSTVYCLLSTVYCLLSTVYCLLSTVYCLLSTVYCLLSTVYCLLSTVYCLLSTVYCLLSTVYCLLSTVYCLLSTVYCLLSTVYCLLSTVYCLLSTVYCLLSTVYCLLSTVYCLLSTVYCLLSTVYCLLSTVYCLLNSVTHRAQDLARTPKTLHTV
ncbi:conserved hypothetical protein [Culex quinquefasciatus]|uniref:Uncharacterized protein n=1 Tax=Culex quinquefasciatus TaxID=7176 RepID=B0WW99_CULQU|nr:conserved hypothetical protein [Culex quinquefasciatus]|eukprot:XP_001861671.1 conserved hypothetical protein [Culex quinquefasciatus]